MRGSGGGGGDGPILKMGVPNNNGPGRTGHGDQRPSKLMMMRDDYHKKILREKEEKMVQLYEDSQMSQKKAMMRIMRGGSGEGSGGLSNGNQTMGNGGGASVRDFFNERRRMEASGVPVPPIDDHFRQAKGYSSPGGWSSRTGSGNSAKKFSAGRDRSQPLAPIRRTSDTREVARTGNTPRGEKNDGGYGSMHADPNPFNARPKLVKHKPLPPTNGYTNQYQNQQSYPNQNNHPQQNNNIDRNNNDKQQIPPPSKFGYQGIHQQRNVQHRQQPQPQLKNPHLQKQQQQQHQEQYEEPLPPKPPQNPTTKQQPQSRINNGKFRSGGVQPKAQKPNPPSQQKQQQQQQPKMTDFQKWQLEQNKAREERLKKFNNNNKNDKNQGYWGNPDDEDDDNDDENNGVYNNKGNKGYEYEEEEEEAEEEEDEDDGQEEEVRRMERELLEKIEREKAELERIRREKMLAEEEEKREAEENKKREKAEKAKLKKLEEQRRKEEEQRRREEEEDERRERQREERERKEEEKRWREEDKRRKEEEKLAVKRDKEEQKRLAKLQKQQVKESARSSQGPSYYDEHDEDPAPSSRRSPAIPNSSRLTMGEIDERPAVSNATDGSYYAKIAKSSEAKGSVGSLAKCKVCGRSFAVDRLKKHQTACSKANKPRKEFDSSKKRVEGTELAKYAGKTKREPPKKKNNWRAQHEEFISSLRYAKKAAQYEKEGKDLRQLTPPPTKENPDLVPCPYCNRTFNETAAERHIPRCKDLKTKPPPMNTRRR